MTVSLQSGRTRCRRLQPRRRKPRWPSLSEFTLEPFNNLGHLQRSKVQLSKPKLLVMQQTTLFYLLENPSVQDRFKQLGNIAKYTYGSVEKKQSIVFRPTLSMDTKQACTYSGRNYCQRRTMLNIVARIFIAFSQTWQDLLQFNVRDRRFTELDSFDGLFKLRIFVNVDSLAEAYTYALRFNRNLKNSRVINILLRQKLSFRAVGHGFRFVGD